jgi:hypothetical protein
MVRLETTGGLRTSGIALGTSGELYVVVVVPDVPTGTVNASFQDPSLAVKATEKLAVVPQGTEVATSYRKGSELTADAPGPMFGQAPEESVTTIPGVLVVSVPTTPVASAPPVFRTVMGSVASSPGSAIPFPPPDPAPLQTSWFVEEA